MRWPNRLTGGAARDLEFRLDSRVRSTWPAFSHVRYLSPVGFQVDLKKKENLPFFRVIYRERRVKRERNKQTYTLKTSPNILAGLSLFVFF